MYIDEDGRIAWFVPILIGAAFGAYSGYQIGKAKGAEGLSMFGYVFGGAVIGGFAGYAGNAVAATGGAFSQTGGIIVGSYYNSVGMTVLSGGLVEPSVSFGAFSYDFGSGSFGYLGKPRNSALENVGYTFGAMANLSDLIAWDNGTEVELVTRHKDAGDGGKYRHSALVNEEEGINISVAPSENRQRISELLKDQDAIVGDNYADLSNSSRVTIRNVNKSILQNYPGNGGELPGGSSLPANWNLLCKNCSQHITWALWKAGVPTLPLVFPSLLHYQLLLRQYGIWTSPFLYNIRQH